VAGARGFPEAVAAPVLSALRTRLGPQVELVEAERLPGGASRATWRLVLAGVPAPHEVVVVRANPEGAPPADLALEAEVLRAAGAAGVPVPEVLAAVPGPPAALVLGFVEGQVLPRRVLGDPDLAGARAVLAQQCGQALARLHAVATASLPQVASRARSAHGGAAEQLGMVRQLLDDLGQPHPALELGWRWLADHLPPSAPMVVVHGDFRTGNLIVGPEGLRAVLDWELVHLGDPHEDLGWLCTPAWRFGSPLPVGGFGLLEDLLEGYRAAGGPALDAGALAWWQAFGTLRWGALSTLQAMTHVRGAVRSVELAAIGRRVCETEADLLDALDQLDPLPQATWADPALGATEPGATPRGPGGWLPHDLPSAVDLLDAVAEHLEDEVADRLGGRDRFLVRVAANVVRMVAREILLGANQEAEHRARLQALGMADDRALAEAVRDGRLSTRDPRVRSLLRAAVAAKLAVANPQRLMRREAGIPPAGRPAGPAQTAATPSGETGSAQG